MSVRAVLAVALVAVCASSAHADLDPCDPHSGEERTYPLSGRLRWDIAGGGLRLADDWKMGSELTVGVTTLFERWHVFSLDLGLRGTVGSSMMSTRLVDAFTEFQARWYPVKLQQATGIDQCGCGTKTRRWSEHGDDGAGYVLLLAGYGHMRYAEAATRDAFTASVGIGYEHNLAEEPACKDPYLSSKAAIGGNRHSLFAEAAWRWDVFGTSSGSMQPAIRIGGLFVEAGVRW